MRIIPNVPPKAFTLSAVIIGYLLIDDTTSSEQNALGNWLMLIAQTLCTNAYFKQMQVERGIFDNNSGSSSLGSNNDINDTIIMLEKMINAINIELNNLKGDIRK